MQIRPWMFVVAALGIVPALAAREPVGNAPQKAPSGLVLGDLAQLSAASMMQAQPTPPAPAPAAPEQPIQPPSLWTLKGFAEFAYTWNFNRPENTSSASALFGGTTVSDFTPKENTLRVFDVNHNEFSIHSVLLDAEKVATGESPVGFKVVAMAGQDAKYIHSTGLFDEGTGAASGGGEDFDLVDAYFTVKVPETVVPLSTTFTVGKWETMHGAEVIHSPYNLNYSRSYLFGFAIPFTHTGVRMDTALVKRPSSDVEMLGVGAAVVNGWDNVKDNNDAKSYMGHVRFSPSDVFKLALATMFGPEQTNDEGDWRGLIDLNATVDFGKVAPGLEGLSISANYDGAWEDEASPIDGNNANWYGFAGYVRYDVPTGRCAFMDEWGRWFLGFRGEYFDDLDGARTGVNMEVMELTTTIGYRPWEALLVRLEHRYDKSDKKVFEERGTLGDKSYQNTFAVDVIVFY